MTRIIAAVLAFFLLAGPGLAQNLSAEDVRRIARAAVLNGDFKTADVLSRALLDADPADAEALLIRAAVARSVMRWDVVRQTSSAAYRRGSDVPLRFDAAMLAAQAATEQERFTAAQVWLRRADQIAPVDAKEQIARSYRQVTARNPFRVQLQFGVTPSNNVNNGAETTVIEIGGLPFQLNDGSQQLGGYEATAGASFSYRLLGEERRRTEVLGEIFAKKVWLNSEAEDLAPDVRASDFDYRALVIGLRETRLFWPELGPSQLTGFVGQSWSGGDRQAVWREIKGTQLVSLEERQALRFGLSFRDERRIDDPINDARITTASGEWILPGDAGRQTVLGATISNSVSDSATVDNLAYRLSATHSFGQVNQLQPRISGSLETRDFRKWSATAGGRRDDSLSLRVDVIFPEISFYGFVPQATLDGRRVWSNVDIYDRNELSFSVTAVSRF